MGDTWWCGNIMVIDLTGLSVRKAEAVGITLWYAEDHQQFRKDGKSGV